IVRRSWRPAWATLPLVLAFALLGHGPFLIAASLWIAIFAQAIGRGKLDQVCQGKLSVDDASLQCNGKSLTERARITAGYVLPTDKGPLVRLELRRRRSTVDIWLTSDAKAQKLLRALDLDVMQRMVRFVGRSRVFERAETAVLIFAWLVAVPFVPWT